MQDVKVLKTAIFCVTLLPLLQAAELFTTDRVSMGHSRRVLGLCSAISNARYPAGVQTLDSLVWAAGIASGEISEEEVGTVTAREEVPEEGSEEVQEDSESSGSEDDPQDPDYNPKGL